MHGPSIRADEEPTTHLKRPQMFESWGRKKENPWAGSGADLLSQGLIAWPPGENYASLILNQPVSEISESFEWPAVGRAPAARVEADELCRINPILFQEIGYPLIFRMLDRRNQPFSIGSHPQRLQQVQNSFHFVRFRSIGGRVQVVKKNTPGPFFSQA